MIKITRLPIENVRVSPSSDKCFDEVSITRRFNGYDGVFHSVRVEVADDDKIGVLTASGVGCQPVDQCSCCTGTSQVAIALTITPSG